jgi:3'(2'), 5'-bisphosphate nucleotidase
MIMPTLKANKELLNKVIDIAWEASKAVLDIYQSDFEYSMKSDGSPLSTADSRSHEIICEKLRALSPNTPIISEESSDLDTIAYQDVHSFWLVDPLDGTKEFIKKNGEFTINIALIEANKPTLGVVLAPVLNILYAGLDGDEAFKIDALGRKQSIRVNNSFEDGVSVVSSRSHGDQTAMNAYLINQKVIQTLAVGSSLKFCKVAEGAAHIYPRLGRTMEWDTAAGHGVLLAAGGVVECLNGTMLSYGKKDFANPHFVAKPQSLVLD